MIDLSLDNISEHNKRHTAFLNSLSGCDDSTVSETVFHFINRFGSKRLGIYEEKGTGYFERQVNTYKMFNRKNKDIRMVSDNWYTTYVSKYKDTLDNSSYYDEQFML